MIEVFVNQKDSTPPPGDTITGIITEQKSKMGTPKFKKASQDDGGKIYKIANCSEPREWKNDFGNFKTYYLTLDDGVNSPAEDKTPSEPRQPLDTQSFQPGNDTSTSWNGQVEASIKALKSTLEKHEEALKLLDERLVALESPRRKATGGSETPLESTEKEKTSTADPETSQIPF